LTPPKRWEYIGGNEDVSCLPARSAFECKCLSVLRAQIYSRDSLDLGLGDHLCRNRGRVAVSDQWSLKSREVLDWIARD
jgi:hypothetical protein